ncbi:hypothetical protein AB0N23_05390 [Streptomyces sp. NPDC052644]
MNATQQHLLDSYRAAQHGVPLPPAPGTPPRRTPTPPHDTLPDPTPAPARGRARR